MTEDKPPKEEPTASTPPERRDEQKKKWYETTRSQSALSGGGLAIYLLFGIVLRWVLDRYIDPEGSTQKKEEVHALVELRSPATPDGCSRGNSFSTGRGARTSVLPPRRGRLHRLPQEEDGHPKGGEKLIHTVRGAGYALKGA
jgi:hypothetical protein